MLSGMGLLQKAQYPEAMSMPDGILKYMNSDAFCPAQEITEDELSALVRP